MNPKNKLNIRYAGLRGRTYAAGGEFTENIDKIGGDGTAEFTYRAIKAYCGE